VLGGVLRASDFSAVFPPLWYSRAIGSMQINCFALSVGAAVGGTSAAALLPGAASMFNHSCAPSVGVLTDQAVVTRFVTFEDVSAGDELCISYVPDSISSGPRASLSLSSSFLSPPPPPPPPSPPRTPQPSRPQLRGQSPSSSSSRQSTTASPTGVHRGASGSSSSSAGGTSSSGSSSGRSSRSQDVVDVAVSVSLQSPLAERQEFLLDKYGFSCSCRKCVAEAMRGRDAL
jgi:hypothetical protein